MSWWLIPSIIGVIAAGVLVGLLVGFLILRKNKKQSRFVIQKKGTTSNVVSKPVSYLKPESNKVDGSDAIPKPVILVDDKVDSYLNRINNSPAVSQEISSRKSEALIELESNLSIANKPANGKLIKFNTEIWDTKRSEFGALTEEVRGELTEAYVDMLLANNLVWLVTELGRNSQDLVTSYSKLSSKVAERLQKIMPVMRQSLT